MFLAVGQICSWFEIISNLENKIKDLTTFKYVVRCKPLQACLRNHNKAKWFCFFLSCKPSLVTITTHLCTCGKSGPVDWDYMSNSPCSTRDKSRAGLADNSLIMIVLIQLAHNSPTKISLWTKRKKDLISIQSVLIKDLVLGPVLFLTILVRELRRRSVNWFERWATVAWISNIILHWYI